MKRGIMSIIVAIVIFGVGFGLFFILRNSESKQSGDDKLAITNSGVSSNTYSNDLFSIRPPSGWEQTAIQGTLAAFRNANETYPDGSAAAQVNFQSYIAVSFDSAKERNLEDIVALTKEQLEEVIPSVAFTSSTSGVIDGQTATFIEMTMTQQEVDYKVLLVVTMKEDKYFSISCNTTQERWAEYRDTFYNVAGSFTFTIESESIESDASGNSQVVSNSLTSDNDAPYEIMSDERGTKHFTLDLINGTFNYSRLVVYPGDSFRLSVMEDGSPVDFEFAETGQTSVNGSFTMVVADDAQPDTVTVQCLERNCGSLEFIIASE